MAFICTRTTTILTTILQLLFTKGLPRGLEWAVACIMAAWLAHLLLTPHTTAIVDGNIILLKEPLGSAKDGLSKISFNPDMVTMHVELTIKTKLASINFYDTEIISQISKLYTL